MIVLQTNWVLFLIILFVLLFVFISQSTDKNKAKNKIRNSTDEFEKKMLKQSQKRYLHRSDIHWIFELKGKTIRYNNKDYNYEELCDLEEQNRKLLVKNDRSKSNKDFLIFKKAKRWFSRMRGLYKKGKLSEQEIDSLNKQGMMWDPMNDPWEWRYKLLREEGLCIIIEDWVKEQRELFQSGKLSKQNTLRLEAINFSFEKQGNETFRLLLGQPAAMKEALRKGLNKYDDKIYKDIFTYEKQNQWLKDKIDSKEDYKKEKKKAQAKFTDDLIKKILREIDKLYKKNFFTAANSAKSKKLILQEKHYKLMRYTFDTYKIDNQEYLYPEQIVVYAAEKTISYIDKYMLPEKIYPYQNSSYSEIDIFINYYAKKNDLEKLIYIESIIDKYPILTNIYKEKILTSVKKIKSH